MTGAPSSRSQRSWTQETPDDRFDQEIRRSLDLEEFLRVLTDGHFTPTGMPLGWGRSQWSTWFSTRTMGAGSDSL